jgi:4-amino-4-deoxy-L-arabinose transferase-like glycosyltransferase
MPFFFRLSATALTDMPTTFFFTLALFLLLRLLQTPTYTGALLIGLCVGLGLLCRYTAALFYVVLFFYYLAIPTLRYLKFQLMLMLLVSSGLLSVWLGYAWLHDIFAAQKATLTVYLRYVTRIPSGKHWLAQVVLFRLPSGLGPYHLPLLCLGGWRMCKCRSASDLLIFLWIAGVCLPLLLTLPGPRYFLPMFPALAIVLARGLAHASKTVEQLVLLAFLYGGGALYLFVDWRQAAGSLFVR